jgi:heptosyltransferase-2
MSASDKHKKNNKESYQYWMSKIAGLPGHDYPIYVPLNKASKIKSDKFVSKYGLEGKTVVGINPGAGKRWKMKRWTTKGFVKLIDVLHKQGVRVLLLGGPEENEVINDIKHKTGGKAINTGTNNAIPDFFAILSLCDLVVTGDTMALHAALGLGKKAVAVFGPTSSSEIFMYGRGEKIAADIECACCYRPDCRVKPNCMETISFEKVWYAVKRQLGLI